MIIIQNTNLKYNFYVVLLINVNAMGNSVSYFAGNSQDDEDLSLENACKLLETSEKSKTTQTQTNFELPDNLVSTKTGEITEVRDDTCIIDSTYVFTTYETDFPVGSKVSFNLYNSDNVLKVTNVEKLNGEWEWDSIQKSDSFWNNRIIICQVEKRVEQMMFLSNSDIVLNLDEVPLEFLPIVGDWLELAVKCMVNENNLDLSGKIIEITRVSPVRLHIEAGKITSWKPGEELGTINNKIFFNKTALAMGYIPVLGDKVVAEVIESDQNRCSWRAVKVLPESISMKRDKINKSAVNLSDCKDSYPGIEIKDISLSFEKLGHKKEFFIEISNLSEEKFCLQKAEFIDSNAQCKTVDSIENTKILPDSSCRILCECLSTNIGSTKEFFVLTFQEVIIGKYVDILVSVKEAVNHIPYTYKANLKLHPESDNQVLKGPSLGKGVRFAAAAPLPNYLIPQKLKDFVSNFDLKETEMNINNLKTLKPYLTSNMTHMNYEDKFHTLLHLDEIKSLLDIRNYDQDRACFIRNAEYLMLEIDNLSERRPSLIIGDKIIATDPMNVKNLDYEGFIHKVGAKHVFLKFNALFHDTYDGEDYSIKVVPGRTAYKRLHHAIHLATRNLGPDLLFPMKILEKDNQVSFTWEKDTPKNKAMSILKKMKERKNKLNSSLESDQSEVKLEWYNEKLNPEQKNAVRNILWGKARPLPYIIFGPPGTGKTVTVIETALQIIRLLPSSRLLITAPSNSAADLIALRLIDSGVLKPGDLVRVVSYNYALSDLIPVKLVPYCATGTPAREDTTITETYNGMRFECNMSTLGRHRITVTTCNASGQFFSMGFPRGHFTHIVIDEAAQASEPEVMIPLAFLDKNAGQVILAGDPMQLGPVIMCKIAFECGLQESYLERLINRFPYIRDTERFPETSGYDPRLVTKLLHSYRALPDILSLYNDLFYNGELIPTIDDQNSPEATLLSSLQEILPTKTNGQIAQVVFHGVDGTNLQTEDSPSWFNPHEAAQIFYYVNEFYRLGMKSSSIGIITPYIKQVKEVKSLLTEAEFDVPRIGTVEEFQGQEFDVIILSTVRSCQQILSSDIKHSLGFVASPKRLNVAISRPKSLLLVIGNPKLLCNDAYWRSVVKYCVENWSYVGCEF